MKKVLHRFSLRAMPFNSVAFVLLLFLLHVAVCATLENERKEGNLRRRRKARPRMNVAGSVKNLDQLKSLEVNFPLNLFDGGIMKKDDQWFDAAVLDKDLLHRSEDPSTYQFYAQAQDQEDIWLYENWFFGMRNGVIMESGALNGILFSTSYMFEKFANWSAIHVEADPENYSNLKVNREHALNIHGALCSEPRLLHYSSQGVLPVRGFVEFMTPSFLKKWHGKVYRNITKLTDLPTVQCIPVKKLLNVLNVRHIDLWVLDTEGAEESVLKGTDFHNVHINVVAMECDQHDIAKNKRKTDILEKYDFECHLIERNCMCKHKDYQPHTSPNKSELRKWNGREWSASYTHSVQ